MDDGRIKAVVVGKPLDGSERQVVLIPGWYVEHSKGSLRDIWVLNPKALPDFLANEPAVFDAESVNFARFHLSPFARTS